MTDKLYRADPYLRHFDAHVVQHTTAGKKPAVILDRTAFYATSGGQPNDIGSMNGIPVVDVIEDEASGELVHVLSSELGSDTVQCEIDWPRRFDHMQQHSGQHILSQAFEQELNAPTVSFHLGPDVCTIDVQLGSMSATDAARIEDVANRVIFADTAVRVHEVTRDELGRFPLRKQPVVSGLIRIVEIEGFDFSPCGGTHVHSAGEIGLIKIRRWEKRGDAQRIDFFCGRRALLDYRWKNDAVNTLANILSVKDVDLRESVERNLSQERDSFKKLEETRQRLLTLEARLLIAETPLEGGLRLIVRAFDDRTAEDVRRLAITLADTPATIALLGLSSADRVSLVFARSADLSNDMNVLLKSVAPIISGRGGGAPTLAQGGGPGIGQLDTALATAQQTVTARPNIKVDEK